MALLVAWLSEADTVPLQDPSASFFRLAFRWLRAVVTGDGVGAADRGPLVRRFFEMLEVNADDRWRVPVVLTLKPPRGEDVDDNEEVVLPDNVCCCGLWLCGSIRFGHRSRFLAAGRL